jgi:hypothetical protein
MKQPTRVYLTNKELLAEVIECKKTGVMSNKLGAMFMKMVHKYGTKVNFCNYSYLEEMKGNAIVGLVKNWQSFDSDKYSNAFAYYTSCIHNQFIQELNYEKKQQKTRDVHLVLEGAYGSWSFQDEYNEQHTPEVIELPEPEVTV